MDLLISYSLSIRPEPICQKIYIDFHQDWAKSFCKGVSRSRVAQLSESIKGVVQKSYIKSMGNKISEC